MLLSTKAADVGMTKDICGIRYHCETCLNFDLCYKCYPSREVVHPASHPFRSIGPEYETETEATESESSEEDDEASGASEG